MALRLRTRSTHKPQVLLGHGYTIYDPTGTHYYLRPGDNSEWCEDELHARAAGKGYLYGGPFTKYDYSRTHTLSDAVSLSNGPYRYDGQFRVSHNGMTDFNSLSESYWTPSLREYWDVPDLSTEGALMYAQAKPGHPTAQLGVALGELLHDGLPHIPGHAYSQGLHLFGRSPRGKTYQSGFAGPKINQPGYSGGGKGLKSIPKSTSNEFLNVEYGWLPFLQDVQQIYRTYKHLERSLAMLRLQNGKWIHKRVGPWDKTLSESSTTYNDSKYNQYPTLVTALYAGVYRPRTYTVTDKVSYWFSGEFKYWIPDIYSVYWPARAVAELFGATPNLAVIWDLTPWTWLFDWFARVAGILHGITDGAAENLLSRNAFAMGRRTRWYTLSETTAYHGGVEVTSVAGYYTETKRRILASPYGFGVHTGDLSDHQTAILAALGISRHF